MAKSQTKSKRKATGGRYSKLYRKKREYEVGDVPTMTKISDNKARVIRTMGGNDKQKLLSANIANLVTKDGKTVKSKIIKVNDNPANRNFVIRNILTKGAIIETENGKARITNRPGQEGTVNATQIE